MRGYLEPEQRGTSVALARGNRAAFRDFLKNQEANQNSQITRLIDEALSKNKLLGGERGVYERLGAKIGVKMLSELLFTLRPMAKPMDFIRGGAAYSDRSKWTLDDYRKFAPQDLQNDPELYARLVRAEGGEDVESHSLEWYRRNNPEYLSENPEVYTRMLEQAKEKRKKEQQKNTKPPGLTY